MISVKAIIFDWDLTLWNSWDLHLWLLEYTADILGVLRPEPDIVASAFTRPFIEHLQDVIGVPIERILPVYMGMYHSMVFNKGHLYKDVKRCLKNLHKAKLKVALFSDKREVFGLSELSLCGLASSFDSVRFLKEGDPYKPNPDGLLQVISELNLCPREVMYIGDSVSDVGCANAAGAISGTARWASVNLSGLDVSNADYQFNNLRDLMELLGIY
ncbi:MAG: HAD hydrolase-like protein [Chloroflexota bacterium]|nr:HAD hydrolase-like protein [Chloroflexota bacterium]